MFLTLQTFIKLVYDNLFILQWTSYQTFLGWGMSELSPLALLNPLDAPRDGSCGIAVPNTVFKVADVSTGENLAPNKEGEICCKGPMVPHTQPKTHFMAKTLHEMWSWTLNIISFIFTR